MARLKHHIKDVRSLREQLGLSQSGLAEQLNTTRETIARWESGTPISELGKGALILAHRLHLSTLALDKALIDKGLDMDIAEWQADADAAVDNTISFVEDITSKVVQFDCIHDGNTEAAYEIIKDECSEFIFNKSGRYTAARECILAGTIHQNYIVALIVVTCVERILRLETAAA